MADEVNQPSQKRSLPEPGQQPAPRGEACLTIYYSCDRQKQMNNYSVNISTGGLFLESAALIPVDTLLTLVFSLPCRELPLTCTARVAWINGAGGLKKRSLPPGMGLQFLDLTLDNMNLIRDFLRGGSVRPAW